MIKLTPSFKEKVWGSTSLEPLFPNSDQKIGEIWFKGVDHLPLLIKFLFTTEKLSVQVHPEDEYARIHHNSLGKTEMWHILAADPGAQIAAGFRENISKEKLREASLSGEIEELLHWYDATPGDTFFIPAGTVHAIGAGLMLCEIQQNSDVTYRLYDYGRPRELHLDHAATVSFLGPHSARASASITTSSEEVLVSCPYFTTTRFQINGPATYTFPANRHDFLIVLEGTGEIGNFSVKAGEVCYLPPARAVVKNEQLKLNGNITLLGASTPQQTL